MRFEYSYTPQEHREIAQEGVSELLKAGMNHIQNVRTGLLEIFPNLLKGFRGRDEIAEVARPQRSTKERTEFLKNLQSIHYSELRELRAYVPEGLTAKYLEYGKTLLLASVHLKGIIPNTVAPYTTYVAHLMSNKGAVLSTDSHKVEHDQCEHNRSQIYTSLNSCLSSGKFSVDTTVTKVVDRNSDWAEVFSDLDSTISNLQEVSRDKIKEYTKQCDDYLNIIHTLLEEDKLPGITPEVAEALTRGAYQVASEIELFSVIYYRALAYEAAVDRTVAKINEILE